ncbi:MAG: hypothetical protein H6737_07695 [Alphaproteobacteria bacterium]|nr:hypothetical protein [Alphaproteobacteria bacterium]
MDSFWVTLVLPSLLAGLVAVLVTLAIERFGGVVGGFVGTLPSTIVPASLGMYAGLETDAFREALCTVPPGMLLNAAFLWLWRVLPPRLPDAALPTRLATMVVVSLSAWSLGAVALVTSTRALLGAGTPPLGLGAVGCGLVILLGVAACWRGVPAPRGRNRVPPAAMVARGVLAAGAIGTALFVAKVGSPLLAGVASVFPAIFLTAMVSLWWSQGDAVSGGAVGPMMLGSAAVGVYALLAALLFPLLGPTSGLAFAWLAAALGITLPATLWLRRRTVGDARSGL